jgi:hypothetical protein
VSRTVADRFTMRECLRLIEARQRHSFPALHVTGWSEAVSDRVVCELGGGRLDWSPGSIRQGLGLLSQLWLLFRVFEKQSGSWIRSLDLAVW